MPIEILMPALSPTMTEGKLARWLKSEGDAVSSGDVIAEIETDKATMEVESVEDGVLGKIVIAGGTENVKVNSLIGVLLEDGESADAVKDLQASSVSETVPQQAESQQAEPEAAVSAASVSAAPVSAALAPVVNGKSGDRIFISPLAKRIAADKGIDLKSLKGSGPRGRIVKADVENYAPTANTSAPAAASVASQQSMTLEPHSMMRKTIARRLTESKQSVPHFYLTVDCELDKLLALRKEVNTSVEAENKISVNDLVVKACGKALKDVPMANVSWTDEGLQVYSSADVAVAVAIDGGLITPVVKGAHALSLTALSAATKDLIKRARAGKLMPEEYETGTFSLSNLGMFGIKNFQAIINPPQACILAVGAGEQRPVVKDGKLEVATVMTCTLSVDHRAVDGAVGAEFLAAFKKAIESPLTLLI
jgi:pyruvate dehydrogenase E2 component (dihydrolipoamide acetyltransferase)